MLLCELFNTAFNSWFRGSKVVDSNGDPLRCYHATNDDFNVFHSGSHFGDAQASRTRAWERGEEKNTRTIPVYLCIKNPLRLRAQMDGDDESSTFNLILRNDYYKNVREKLDIPLARSEGIYVALEKLGYDGLVYNNSWDSNDVDSWVVFHSNQVKSAISNTGNYDPSKPEIDEAWDTPPHENDVFTNPPKNKLIDLIKKSRQQLLKGIVYDDDFYVWDAYEYHHNQVRKFLGLPSNIDFILALSGDVLDREANYPGHTITSDNFAIQTNGEPDEFNECRNFTRSIGLIPDADED